MNLQWIFDLVNYVIDKEQIGNAISANEFNTLLPSVQWELVNAEMDKITKDELTPIAGELITGSLLNPFKTTIPLTVANGIAQVPKDYVRFMSFTQTGADTGTGAIVPTLREITPVASFARFQNNIYARLDIHPIVKILGYTFTFIPNDIPLVNLDYIRTPATPFYDYCQDAITGNAIYMPVGSYINAIDNVNYLYDVNSILLASDVVKDNMNALPWKSQTVELEWEQRAYEELVLRLLSRAGVNLSAEGITQYAETKLKEQA
jgi:hypothetical protein